MMNSAHNFYNRISLKIIFSGVVFLSLIGILSMVIHLGIIDQDPGITTWLVSFLCAFAYCKKTLRYYDVFVRGYEKTEQKVVDWLLDWVFNVHGH